MKKRSTDAPTLAQRFAARATLKQIRHFIAVAETGKFSSAASISGLSPSVVTVAIGELEALLDVSLFNRSTKGVELTLEGQSFLAHARHIITSLENAGAAVQSADSEARGSISLVTTSMVLGFVLPPLLSRFRAVFPNIQVSIAETKRAEAEKGLASGSFEIGALTISNLTNRKVFLSRTLMSSMHRLWLPQGHFLLDRKAVTLKDLAGLPYIQLTLDDAERITANFWNKYNLQPHTITRCETVEAVRSLVANGMGITILPELLYRPSTLASERIEIREIQADIPPISIGIAWPRGHNPSLEVNTFLDFCQANTDSARHSQRR